MDPRKTDTKSQHAQGRHSNSEQASSSRTRSLKILPAYTGIESIDGALSHPRATRLIWLEILVNDQMDLSQWDNHPVVQEAYNKACCWYTAYRSLLTALLARRPLPLREGPIDPRDHRTFLEAVRFASPHT